MSGLRLRKRAARLLSTGIGSILCLSEACAQATNTVNGLSGYIFAPSAAIAPKGSVTIDYSPSVPGADRLDGHNLSLLFGLTPFVELAGRVAANTLQCNMYAEPNCGMRDLSASGKFGFDLAWLSPRPLFQSIRIAAGATDVGGAATSFHSKFLLASYIAERFELTGGIGKTAEGISRHMPLDGPFAGGAFSIFPWAKLQVEAARDHRLAGLSFFDEKMLKHLGFPSGSRLHFQVNKSLTSTVQELPQTHLSMGIRIPLDSTVTLPRAGSDVPARQKHALGIQSQAISVSQTNAGLALQQPAPPSLELSVKRGEDFSVSKLPDQAPGGSQATPASQAYASERARLLPFADTLAQGGFSDIAIGLTADRRTVVLSVNNMAFTHGELDALGVALGNLAFVYPIKAERYRLILNRWNLPILWVDGDLECLRSWLLGSASCAEENALRLHFHAPESFKQTSTEGQRGHVSWVVRDHRPAWEKLRLHLGPNSHYTFATEFGIWDYSLAAVINPWLHLWQGAVLEGTRQVHVGQSRDYDPGGIFAFWKMRTGNGRIMLHQAFTQTSVLDWPLGGRLSGRLSLGQPFPEWLGGGGEIRWDSVNGRHTITLASHRYTYQGDLPGYVPGQPSMIAYRLMPDNSDWQLEANYGRWWNRDQSLSLASRHWFGDVNLGFFLQSYRDARPLWFGGREVSFAGIELSFPLSLRREVHTGSLPIDIRGLPRYSVGLATTVGRTDNAFVGGNGFPLYAHLGLGSAVPFATGAILKDFDRLGPAYTPFHLDRVRYAFDRWVKPDLPPDQ